MDQVRETETVVGNRDKVLHTEPSSGTSPPLDRGTGQHQGKVVRDDSLVVIKNVLKACTSLFPFSRIQYSHDLNLLQLHHLSPFIFPPSLAVHRLYKAKTSGLKGPSGRPCFHLFLQLNKGTK